MSDNDQLGQLPEPFETERYFAGPHDRTFDLYTSDQMRAYAAQQVAAERERWMSLCEQALDALKHHREQTRPICRSDAAIHALQSALGPCVYGLA